MQEESLLGLVAIIGLILLALVVVVLALKGYFSALGKRDSEGNIDVGIQVGQRKKRKAD